MSQNEEEINNKFVKLTLNTTDTSSLGKSTLKENEEEVIVENKKGCQFPTAYTILIIIEIIVFILTYIIPKGKFDTIEYSSNKFIIKSYNKDDIIVNATESVLEKYKIKIPLDNFVKGYIKNPISIPDTYQRIEDETTNFFYLFLYPILGLIESSNISFLLLILGGNLNILIEMKALSSGMSALSRLTKGKGFLLACLVFLLISIGGTTFGMAEEILAFNPILIPIFLKSGLDGILAISSIYLGTCIGNMFSTVNAFSVVIASHSAGISFIKGITFRVINYVISQIFTIIYFYYYYRQIQLDEQKSICYDIKKDLEDKFLKDEKEEKQDIEKEDSREDNPLLNKPKEKKEEEFTCIQKISIILFISGFTIMTVGVLLLNWWFEEMTALFFILAIILMFLLRQGEAKAIEAFIKGAGDFCGVAMIVGIARGINITLEDGKISDTILNFLANAINGLPKVVFAFLMFLIFNLLGFFIQSHTGLALLSMPVLAPLADKVSCSRTIVVDAYLYGQNLIGIIAPTGLILIIVQMVGLKFNHFMKFIYPYMIILFIYLTALIIVECFI